MISLILQIIFCVAVGLTFLPFVIRWQRQIRGKPENEIAAPCQSGDPES